MRLLLFSLLIKNVCTQLLCVRHSVRVCGARVSFLLLWPAAANVKRACEIVAREKVREGRRSENTLICEARSSSVTRLRRSLAAKKSDWSHGAPHG